MKRGKLLNIVENFFEPDGDLSYEYFNKGYSTKKWIITCKNKQYILKKIPTKNDLRAKFIMQIHEYLYENNMTVEIISTIDGGKILKKDGKFYIMLTKINTDFNNITNIEFAKLLAKLHSILNLYPSNIESVNIKNYKLFNFNELNNKTSKYREIIEFKYSILQKNKFLKKKINNKIIHGDFYEDNVLFEKKTNMFYIIDFDNTSYGSRSYEIISSGLKCCFNIDSEIMLENFLNYLKTYISHSCNVNLESFQDLYDFLEEAEFVIANDTYLIDDKNYNKKYTHRYIYFRFTLLKWYVENKVLIYNELKFFIYNGEYLK